MVVKVSAMGHLHSMVGDTRLHTVSNSILRVLMPLPSF
jgi:hypothetical protein